MSALLVVARSGSGWAGADVETGSPHGSGAVARRGILAAVAHDRRLSREERVASLIRVGELELTGENEAEVDAYFAPEFIFHSPDGAELD
jgi:hypothetical protein